MKALVIYYSRTGTTKKLAQMIGQRLRCDCEEIRSTDSFKGIFGYIKAGRQAISNTLPSLRSVKRDPAAYDIVVLGTPVHASRMAAPVRSFLSGNQGKLKKLAIFVTHQASECESVVRGIEDLVGMKAVSQLCVRAPELDTEELKSKVDNFVACIRHVSD